MSNKVILKNEERFFFVNKPKIVDRIEAGIYSVKYDQNKGVYYFEKRNNPFESDKYFPLQNYQEDLASLNIDLNTFFNNQDFYDRNNINYKRSYMLFSDAGMGKSQYLSYVSDKIISTGGLVFHDTNLEGIKDNIDYLEEYHSNDWKVVIIEELCDILNTNGGSKELLTFLDNTSMKNKWLIFITTNFPERIPNNLIDRPTRMDMLTKVRVDSYTDNFYPDFYTFITGKEWSDELVSEEILESIKNELSIDYYKELMLFSELHGMSLEQAWNKVKQRRRLIKNNFEENKKSVGFGDDEIMNNRGFVGDKIYVGSGVPDENSPLF